MDGGRPLGTPWTDEEANRDDLEEREGFESHEGAATYPIDWEKARGDESDEYDASGPWADWEGHMDEVAARAVVLPEDVAGLLRQLREGLDEIVGDEPLVALKAVGELEAIVASAGPLAAACATGDEIPVPRVAEALGMTEKAARSRLVHYAYLPR
ncbi:hypothetical protein ACIGW4_38035 [Streptomyces sp. NPDC053513]|uniref:hypothetical protein n=1 Tax=unclassified Streptomyces TaxID=2593676 RepID=UPI0037D20058